VLDDRRSRTTYCPTVAPTRSTHTDSFTGTTSSFMYGLHKTSNGCREPGASFPWQEALVTVGSQSRKVFDRTPGYLRGLAAPD
jgi:hypothetical protein